jgi:hypothetical protein
MKAPLERYNSETLFQMNSNSKLGSLELHGLNHRTSKVNNNGTTLDSQRFGGSLCNVLPSANLHLKRNGELVSIDSMKPFLYQYSTFTLFSGSASTLNIDTSNLSSVKSAVSAFDSKWSTDMNKVCIGPINLSHAIRIQFLNSAFDVHVQQRGPDKGQNWESETKHLQALYEVHLRAAHQRSVQLEEERRRLRTELDEAVGKSQQSERLSSALRQDLDSLRSQLEEMEWALCQRAGEMALIKAQLKDSQVHEA